MKLTQLTFLLLIALLTLFSCTQERIENRITLNTFDNGQVMREHVKYKDNDTLVEFIYFQDGQVNCKRQLLNNQRTGMSYLYNLDGELLYQEHYLNGHLTGDFKAFYPSGKISRIEHFEENKNIDTTIYYDKQGQVTKKVAFLDPCDLGSCECNQFVIMYENGSKIYSYKVQNGLKSKEHTVFDQEVYQRLIAEKDEVSLYEKGKFIFQMNCGMCHKINSQSAGVAFDSFSRTMTNDELYEFLGGSTGHPVVKATHIESDALIEYINRGCP